ncbi:MAG: metallophosphoesterase, partial [Planctomycetaceae bacterium]
LLLGVLAAVGIALLAATAPRAIAEETAAEPSKSEPFSIVLLPDTQFYSLRHPETYRKQTEWIKEQAAERNIRFVIHLGDIVHENTEAEWKRADEAQKVLDGVVPYSLVPGNHDMVLEGRRVIRDTSRYNSVFPPSRYKDEKWYGGSMTEDSNDNNYCLFEAGGMKFIVISLEFAPRDEALGWAGNIAAKHSDRHAIVATHCYLRPAGRDTSCASGYSVEGNSGQEMWDKLIRRQPNIFLVVSGHFAGTNMQTSENDAGGKVIEMLADYQNLANGGNGWLRVLTFDPAKERIRVETYSPTLDEVNPNERHTYGIEWRPSAVPLKKAG